VKWEDRLDIGGLSDVGMRRSNNQDSFRILTAPNVEQWRSRGHLFVVADGMGAHAVGELASKMAVDSIAHSYHKLVQLPVSQAIVKAVQDANTLIHNRGTANKEFQGMGTTSTALLLLPEGAMIAHVGDSRAYRVREGRIEQLSFDHSLAWELVRRKQLTLEQARTMVPTNVITRSLGPEGHVDVDVEGPHAVLPGDVFVLCSDGLSGQVNDPDIGLIARHLPAQEACQYLIDMANLRGGPDNITLIVVRVEDPSQSDPAIRIPEGLDRKPAPNYSMLLMIAGFVGLLACAAIGVLSPALGHRLGPLAASLLAGTAVASVAMAAAGYVWRRLTQPRDDDEPPPRQATAYRKAPCTLDQAALDRFNQRLQQVRSIAVEQAWNVDWTEFFAHRNHAEALIAAGDRVAALREFCLAQRLLSIGQKRFQEQTQSLLGGA
jgi:protein phosphatase